MVHIAVRVSSGNRRTDDVVGRGGELPATASLVAASGLLGAPR
ncbi:hypothetical protein ACFORH_14055 [Amycolatopsis roodepoortensis]|uniref:Uncharacterized protein n=1 Tax=Amycolatopsis roodepoortensis TaxID=700274 RepID=A0ABR9KYM6_9PSEU|nr:hypothetical protein [Amycolatopsis roodepoortensis]MBE1573468.1 hypothetical protein [Amycolatopsis roodepoortensis]